MKRQFVKCSPQAYSELIRSNILGPSGVKPSLPFEPSGAKFSRPSTLGPPQYSVMMPSQEELQARVELLAKKKRSAKSKVLATPQEQPCGWR